MKVGFLSIDRQIVSMREAQIAMFDGGHTADVFMTVGAADTVWAVQQILAVCEVIVIEGNTEAFYTAFGDKLTVRAENFELDGKCYALTPAATDEYLYETLIKLLASKKKQTRYKSIVFKTYGKTVAELEAMLKDFCKSNKSIKIGYFPQPDECEVHARYSLKTAQSAIADISLQLNKILYSCTYAYDRVTIEQTVSAMLKATKLRVKTAESFTGGAIAKALTSLPGASEYFTEGLVTYSVGAKINRLMLDPKLIAEKGVVSGETVYGMAYSTIKSGDCDVVIATTGNAGPTVGGNGDIGSCFIAIGNKDVVNIYKYQLNGDRQANIESGVKKALFLLFEYLISYQAAQKRARSAAADNGEGK